MKEKTKAFYKTVFKNWWQERAKPFLKKALTAYNGGRIYSFYSAYVLSDSVWSGSRI